MESVESKVLWGHQNKKVSQEAKSDLHFNVSRTCSPALLLCRLVYLRGTSQLRQEYSSFAETDPEMGEEIKIHTLQIILHF